MKKLLLCAALSFLCFGAVACDDEDGDDGGSVKDICSYIMDHNGDYMQIIEIIGDISADNKDKAMDLCVEEINNMPVCKSQYIDEMAYIVSKDFKEGAEEFEKLDGDFDKCKNDDGDGDNKFDPYISEYENKYKALAE